MSSEPIRTADHIPADSVASPDPTPETLLPTNAARPATTLDPNRTTGLDAPADGWRAEEVPGYELLGELGRGGMGIVFRARDTRLNRTVALKMMLGRPDTAELMRFRAEAEAMAAVRHPNVAQVFEAGEFDGRPFLALELLSAGTLSDYLRAHRERGPAVLADVVRKVATGVAAAHAQGIVHRDLKPGNVLFDDTGEPKVTDFGLAKRGTGSDLTQTGQVMGTPAYMAPEQADGNAKFVGPQADVWALGVILYEAITEARPFAATDISGVLAAVLTAEPAAPRKRNPAVPRDLELICLKCLSKQPHERYATAKELTDDLERYATGKPISVRPAGPFERGYKWVKRNKVVSGAALAVFLALAVGAGVSFAFGVEARDQAADAKKQKKDADDAAEREKGEAKRADREKQEAREQRDRATTFLVQAMLRSLNARDRSDPLSLDEVDTFWQLAELRDTPINGLFLQEAARSPRACAQLESRAEFAIHAAIGLNPDLRTRADQLLASGLQSPASTVEQRKSLALACAHWGSASPGTNGAAAKVLTEALGKANDSASLEVLATALTGVAPGSEAAKILTEALGKANDSASLELLATALTGVAPGSEAVAAQLILDVMARTTDPQLLGLKVASLRRVVKGMEPAAAELVCTRAVEIATGTLAKSTDPFARTLLELYLSPLVERMEPVAAAKYVLNAATNSTEPLGRMGFALNLAVIAPRLERDAARAACEPMIKLLLDEMDAATVPQYRRDFAIAISRLTPHTGRDASERAVKILTDAMDKTKDPATRATLAVGLVAVSPGTETTAAKLLVEAAIKPKDTFVLREFAVELSRLARRLEPATASEACERVAKVLADAVARANPQTRTELASAFSELMAYVEPVAAARLLTDVLTKTKDPKVVGQLATALVAVISRLEPVAAARVREQIVKVLTDATDKANSTALASLTPGLVAVASHVEPVAATKFLTDAMAKTNDPATLAVLAAGLSAVVPRLERGAAAETCDRIAKLLVGVPPRPTNRPANRPAALSLSAIALGVPVGHQRGSRTVFVTGAFSTPHNVLPSLLLLDPYFHPQPRPLPPQTLVELLKHPFCIGESQRAVLDALAFAYKRPFADQWEFVEYAQKHQPQLDLYTPPKRPQARP